jgi:hypothetical protein
MENSKMSDNKVEIEEYLNKWQKILRLRDWDIAIKMVEAKWRKSGDIKIDLEDKKAVLLINQNPKCTNMEELVIHELLHLKLYGMDQMIEDLLSIVYGKNEDDAKREFAYTRFMVLLESTVEDLTKGYLTVNGSKKPLSFGRLQKEIDKELG